MFVDRLLLIVGLSLSTCFADELDDCVRNWLRERPTLAERLSREHLRAICEKKQFWEKTAQMPASPVADFLSPDQLKYLQQLRECRGASDCFRLLPVDQSNSANRTESPIMPAIFSVDPQTGRFSVNINRAITGGVGGGQSIAVRKEYRSMSDDERARYHRAVQRLKTDRIDGLSKYDLLVVYHTPQEAPEAHWGPAFLPYHREYLKQYELALRQIEPSVGLPYWDSTLDERLPNPIHSILWTKDFFGTSEGPVSDGPFAGWSAMQELPQIPGQRRLTRQVGSSPFGGLYKEADVQFVLNRLKYEDLTSCVDTTFELLHGLVHSFVGGYMSEISISPNDPAFFLHHNFIDHMWELFRQNRQTLEQRERDYPTPGKSCNDFHLADAQMKPFGIRNKDGLSNVYTRELYQFQPRPSCAATGTGCTPTTPYLFCDRRVNRCVSKVKLYGNCTGYEGQDVCYQSVCVRGLCQTADSDVVIVTERPPTAPPSTTTRQPWWTFPTRTSRPQTPLIPNPPYTLFPTYAVPTTTTTTTTSTTTAPQRPPIYGSGSYGYLSPIPTAYFTVTVVRGQLGYSARPVPEATVKTIGLGSPSAYHHVAPGLCLANTTYPSYVGACIVKVYDPDRTDKPVKFAVEANDGYGQPCKIQCWNEYNRAYGDCSQANRFSLSSVDVQNSSPIMYYGRSQEDALSKRWTGEGYNRMRWPDHIVFQCQ